ncbi:hypothetical protein L9F63_020235, partial [Diploptera punctata]
MSCDLSSPKRKLIAVCQMTATNNKRKNIETCMELIKLAKDADCLMTFLPEACDYIGKSKEESLSMAEPLDGETLQLFCDTARQYEMWLSLGGIHEQILVVRLKHSHVVIDSKGGVVAVYRKVHLFDVDIKEQGIRLMESDYVIAGDAVPAPVHTPVGNVALSVCYDMRFPELSLALSGMKADILTFPSAFTYVTGAGHWETILKARAIETQSYVVAAAQTGSHNEKRTSWGHAMVVDPWGTVICQCTEGTNFAVAEIKLDYIQEIKCDVPVWKHRRTDLYSVVGNTSKEYLFCGKIVNEERIICKTESTLAFMSCSSIVTGHVLVIPLRKVSRLSDLNVEETADMFDEDCEISSLSSISHQMARRSARELRSM